MIGIYILVISIMFQIAAAVLAVRLMRLTGKHFAWTMITVAVVLMAIRRVISYLGSGSKFPDVFAESIALIISIFMMIGIALIAPIFIEQKRTEEALREQDRQMRSLLRLSRRLERAYTYKEALNAARDEVKTIIGYQDMWAYIFTEDRKYANLLVAGKSIEEKLEKLTSNRDIFLTLTIKGDRMLEEIAEAKDIVVVEDARTDERTDKKMVALIGNRTIINVPIFIMDRHLGSMGTGTYDNEDVRAPTKSEKDYLIALASHMAVTLDRLHLLTQRKVAEDALRESREMYQRIVDTTNESIWSMDEKSTANFINARMAQMLGYQREEIIGKKIDSFVFDEDIPDHIKKLETLRLGNAEQYERRWRNKDGHAVWTIVSATPIFHQDGRFGGSFAMITDITKRKQVEEELQKYREHLEELVKERTEELEKKNVELEKFNRLFVGRELKMIELKKKISELEKQIFELKNKNKES